MAVFSGPIYSEVLQMKTNITVVTPHDILITPDAYPVVYLLHGLSGNACDWTENAQLTRLSDAYNIIFVVPEVQRSFYTDMEYGLPYYTYISDELPKICQKLYPVSSRREDTYVMGLSMGGYGALKCALKKPEQYAGCAAFSPACILEDLSSGLVDKMSYQEMQAIWGMNLEKMPENDVRLLARECEKKKVKPRIFMTCGTEDFIYDMSRKFREFIKEVDIPFTYREWPGIHEWYLWNKSLHLACAHFFERVAPENYCNIV